MSKLESGIPQQKLGERYWRVLLYGLTGAGKTRTAATWPKPLFLDCEDGLGSVDRKIAWVRITEWGHWMTWLDKLATGKRMPIETIVIDSVNALQRLAMEHSVHEFGKVKRAHGDIPGMSDYGKMFWDTWRSLQQAFELPYHIVLTAQAKWGDFDELHKPEFVGQAINQPLLQAMDLVGVVERNEQACTLSFSRTDAVTKDRFGLFTGIMENPTWEELERKTKESKPKKEPKMEIGTPSKSDEDLAPL